MQRQMSAHAASHDPNPSLRTALVGFVALAPAIGFGVANVFRWVFDVQRIGEIAGPVVRHGGGELRTLLEAWSSLGPIVALLVIVPDTVSIRRAPGSRFGVEVRVAPSAIHIALIVASIVVLALFAGYQVAEAMFTPSFAPGAD
ncbi:MAG: hypothetical protein WEA10_08490 [Actinomycetota bacterium]